MTVQLKDEFLERHRKILEDKDFDKFVESCTKPTDPCIRVNTLRVDPEEFAERVRRKYGWIIEKIPWCAYGYRVKWWGAIPLGSTLEYQLGYYYVQDAASMIPPLVLDPKPGEKVLDLCAAPGSKTTQMAQMMQNRGIIIANDIRLDRITALRANIQRMGCINVIVTMMDGRKFKRFRNTFDKVLVDAPCTGTGTVMNNPSAVKHWSPKTSKSLARLQYALLNAAIDAAKPGGIIVYSTCSLEPEEDELVVAEILEKREDVHLVDARVEGLRWMNGLTEWEGRTLPQETEKCMRIYPHFNNTEGFFIAKFVKEG